jgi:hypothetical protein
MGHRRIVITWVVLGGLMVAAFAGTVIALNATLYSASGFAGTYLAALSRHDVSAAVELAGPASLAGGEKAGRELLDSRALGELSDIRLVGDTAQPDGRHRVTYSYSLTGTGPSGSTSNTTGTTTFTVERAGTRMGLFSAWRFTTSPIGALTITPRHDAAFTVNDMYLSSTGPDVPRSFLALAPGNYLLGHDSDYFTAKPVPVPITRAGVTTKAAVDVQANSFFTKQVQKGLDGELKKCAIQKVLLPTGCPFGKQIGDRIEGAPAWSIVRNPVVRIAPGGTPGTWQVPQTEGAAHLTVHVRSIFDGSVSTFDEDVPFTVSYLISFKANGQLVITGQ